MVSHCVWGRLMWSWSVVLTRFWVSDRVYLWAPTPEAIDEHMLEMRLAKWKLPEHLEVID